MLLDVLKIIILLMYLSKIDPLDDIETINLELQLADLESLNNKKTSLEKKLKANDKEASQQFDIIE